MSTLVTESALVRVGNWRLTLVIFAAAILLTRLPSVIGNPHLPDGDEALIGVMAQHVAQGESIPLFPWGQRYGLATPEVLLAATGFKVFGESLAVLRGAVLFEWGFGALLFMAAVRRIGRPSVAIGVGAMLISCPGWLGMSIRASATFVTGFFFSGAALYAMGRVVELQSSIGFSPGLHPSRTMDALRRFHGFAFMAGLATVLAGCANPFWLPFLLPLLAAISWRRLTLSDGIAVVVGAGLTALGILVAFSRGSSYWEPPLFDHPNLLVSLGLLPQRLQDTLTGTYFLTYATPAGPFTSGLGLFWTVLTAFALLRTAWRVVRHHAEPLETGLAVSLVATLAITLIITPSLFGHRYLIPAVTASALLLGFNFSTINRSVRIALGCVLLLALPFVTVEFRHISRLGYDMQDQEETTAAMDGLLAYLDHQGIHHVYSIDPMLQWNIMFASRGRVTARWLDALDRHPAFPLAVDCAVAHGERTALVGRISQLQPNAQLSVPSFDHQFFAAPGLRLDDLSRLGFKINKCE